MSIFGWHESWDRFTKNTMLDVIDVYGCRVYDKRSGKEIDIWSAIDAEAFGPEWETNPEWIKFMDQSPKEPIDQRILDAARNLIRGVDWCDKPEPS